MQNVVKEKTTGINNIVTQITKKQSLNKIIPEQQVPESEAAPRPPTPPAAPEPPALELLEEVPAGQIPLFEDSFTALEKEEC